MFGKLFGKKKDKARSPNVETAEAASASDGGPQPNGAERPLIPTDMKSLIGMAMAHTQALQKGHVESWGLGHSETWDVDLEAGTIRWVFADKVARAPAELIGTYSEKDGSFLWGWNHPSSPKGSAVAAAAVKSHADTHGLEQLQASKVNCGLDDCWSLSSTAVLIGDLQGVYRGNAAEGVYAFIGFGHVTLSAS